MWPNPQCPADLVTFTEETFNRNFIFLWSDGFQPLAIFAKKNLFSQESSIIDTA